MELRGSIDLYEVSHSLAPLTASLTVVVNYQASLTAVVNYQASLTVVVNYQASLTVVVNYQASFGLWNEVHVCLFFVALDCFAERQPPL